MNRPNVFEEIGLIIGSVWAVRASVRFLSSVNEEVVA